MENNIEKMNKIWLMLVWIYIAAAVIILLYGDFFLKEIITSAIGVALMINYLVRKRKYKDELKPDEMTRKMAEMSSNIAFISTLTTIALLAIALETFPALIDAKGILAVLVAVIIFSKITGQLYYSRIKKEIGF
ncbi:MAG: hypothetical protein KKD46_03950 [Euryarchaeota archaeon]|nr:hypothetical protein [Euryarchaeota archaeon]MCG2735704.1 hypothetical protein [Candidatus Methanoperedenaceae archaeon]